MKNTDKLLSGFIEHLKALNRTSSTIKTYNELVKHFLKSLTVDVKMVTADMINDYILVKSNKPNTVSVKVRAIKRFFEFLESANIIFINPAEYIKEPLVPYIQPKEVFTLIELAKILKQPDLDTKKGMRDRAVLELLYSTGIRLNELCSLTVYDADFCGKMLRIRQHGRRKSRVLPVSDQALFYLKEYINKSRPHYTRNNKSIRQFFTDVSGNPISKDAVAGIIRNYAKAAKIKKRINANTFRYAFTKELVKNKADITAIQKMLGHIDLKATMRYVSSLKAE